MVTSLKIFAQPVNDHCANASVINVGNAGYALGVFSSSQSDLTQASLQAGETFAASINTAGLNKKSVWYKFTLPTTRSVRVTLLQPGSAIQAGNVGFTVYKANGCIPAAAALSTKLTPIETFGNTFHPCVTETGDYYVQVSGNNNANGPIYINLDLQPGTPTAYDHPATASKFGKVTNHTTAVQFAVECQSLDDASEKCLPSSANHTKSTWHTFTTPDFFDWFGILLSSTGNLPINGNKIGFSLFEGDGTTTPLASLIPVISCDSFTISDDAVDYRAFRCGGPIKPNTTYTVKLLYPDYFNYPVRFAVSWDGHGVTRAPQPVNSIPVQNKLGVLPQSFAGVLTTPPDDYMSCNSRHSLYNCPKAMPANGLSKYYSYWPDGSDIRFSYNLSNFYTFSLAEAATLNLSAGTETSFTNQRFYLRLFKQGLSANCADLDTANIIAEGFNAINKECFAPGDYVLQVMGTDSALVVPQERRYLNSYWMVTGANNDASLGLFHHLGNPINLSIKVTTQYGFNKYSLSAPGKYFPVNSNNVGVMQPLASHQTYALPKDTMGCNNTVLPDNTCFNNLPKASYYEFVTADSGSMFYTSWSEVPTRIYKGDANALVTAQSKFNYPDKFTGLTPYSSCIGGPHFVYQAHEKNELICITPGTFTLVGIADLKDKYGSPSITHNLTLTFKKTKAKFDTPAKAEDMGDLWAKVGPGGGGYASQTDTFTCYDNPATIDGLGPCLLNYYNTPASKLAYRQFYLSKPTLIAIEASTSSRLFFGKATDGLAGLKLVGAIWNCFTSNGNNCLELPAGWYTIVTYAWGINFAVPTEAINTGENYVDRVNWVRISLKLPLCKGSFYNRPYKAAIDTVTNQPFLIQWGPRAGHTAAYPKTDTAYRLYTETFTCTDDTPFVSHPITACAPGYTKVAYWVFKTTQESFVKINMGGLAAMYAGNIRKDSALFATATPIQPCTTGEIQICRLQPGEYTLVLFGNASNVCQSAGPTIYIDQVGFSRFDHAAKAYDFGLVGPTNTWYYGKPGDVNPLNPGRAPSNDFFYCTTGAQPDDPVPGCRAVYLSSIYNNKVNNALFAPNAGEFPLRNLWYTFTVDQPGTVRVKVDNKTIGRGHTYNIVVLKSNVDGSLPYGAVVGSGLVDSTYAQGLVAVAGNNGGGPVCVASNETSFARDLCLQVTRPERYYIVVQNRYPSELHAGNGWQWRDPNEMLPNHQVEISVRVDAPTTILPKFDHYTQASVIGTNLGPGVYTGAKDNINCATMDASDPRPPLNQTCVNRTLWYKFSTNVSGTIIPRANKVGVGLSWGMTDMQLYREIINGDSTAKGLQYIDIDGGQGAACISPGTYYLLIVACDPMTDATVYPQIELIDIAGDFCSKPVVTNLNGAGSKAISANIGCHTIGTDYGEFNPTLTCPTNAKTTDYKTTWYRLDINGSDTLDVTVFIDEKTNAASTEVKYRMMTGNCNAMQEQSCVQDALTRNTYKCLAPGNSYFIQVFTPILSGNSAVSGTVDLVVSAVKKTEACLPPLPCIAVANFSTQFDCTKDRDVQFINSSTYGTSIKYEWDFGYNNQKSTAIVPQFFYPALTTPATYTVRLIVTNLDCNKKDTAYQTFTIPGRPAVNLGKDTIICTNGVNIVLNATTHNGSTYNWYNGANTSTITVNANGSLQPWVEVTYNNCKARDTVSVWINPISRKPMQTMALCNVYNVDLNATRSLGEAYKWNTGSLNNIINVEIPGYYWCDLVLNGCTVRDSFLIVNPSAAQQVKNIRVCQSAMPYAADATVVGATAYKWNDNSTIAKKNLASAGTYWVDITISGCTYRDTLKISVDSFKTQTATARICQGQSYKLPSGKLAIATGTFKDSLKNIRGCDSLITTLTLKVDSVIKRTINTSICTGQFYTFPSGRVVNTAGIYADTARYVGGCDSVISNVNLLVASPVRSNINDTICAGKTYTLPSGKIINSTGIFSDTLKAKAGCDSAIITFNIQLLQTVTVNANASICFGKNYTLPSGRVVSLSGLYRDTLRYKKGCDSLISNITVNVGQPIFENKKIYLCAGQTFTLPSGRQINSTGQYNDTVRGTGGCDSLISAVDATVQNATSKVMSDFICGNKNYMLPSGKLVNGPGTYLDTSRYASGCDSIRYSIQLAVYNSLSKSMNVSICPGKTYVLPSGRTVNASGLYRDTIRYTNGCDSLVSTITLNVGSPVHENKTVFICQGQNYTLPSGRIINSSGTYNDTARSAGLCDSITSVVDLTVQSISFKSFKDVICAGKAYLLPSGKTAINTGQFFDTLRYRSGCDSIRYVIDLTSFSAINNSTNVNICAGKSFILPSGRVLNSNGVYRDTIRYANGCDSLISNITLSVSNPIRQNKTVVICQGQNYTLPSGRIVNTTGMYNDTTRTIDACDSMVSVINLTVQKVSLRSITDVICAGKTYPLPSGKTANSTGQYFDTLRYSTGCDSIRYVFDLILQKAITNAGAINICAGNTYTLPSGRVVNSNGLYRDTIRFTTGCDSLISNITLTVSNPVREIKTVTICSGQNYKLPSGRIVATPGIYQDTMRTLSGCDSSISSITLRVDAPVKQTIQATICSNTFYTSPSGKRLNTTGAYADTIRNQRSCDSIHYNIALRVEQAARNNVRDTICQGAVYTLPKGRKVSSSGLYTDTLRTINGCDSIISTALFVAPLPTVRAGNDTTIMVGNIVPLNPIYSNDIVSYSWSPADQLNCANCANPVSTPLKEMVYKIEVVNVYQCKADDSKKISLFCNSNSIFLPNSFTPNGDGINDIWYPRGNGIQSIRSLRVFNRWGQLVFERSNFSADDKSAGWDGRFKGQILPADVFVYSLGMVCSNGQMVETKGNVMIVR